MVTSNHVHLLVKDTGSNVIARSMQLIASRTAQEYNQRKVRHGAFWEDRYHATAVDSDDHLRRCLVYIDLNMVRAGAVKHPSEWAHCGYSEIQKRNRAKGSNLELSNTRYDPFNSVSHILLFTHLRCYRTTAPTHGRIICQSRNTRLSQATSGRNTA